MSFSIGIVGLPNVGKSTLFQALTKKAVDVANYPFCTIDPNVGVVKVPDERVDTLARLSKTQTLIHTTIEFVDIAGLVKGAHKGEGLGNKFLANIREVDAIVQVVRGFESKDIIHVHGRVNPHEDVEIINAELILADLESVMQRVEKLERQKKGVDEKSLRIQREACELLKVALERGALANTVELNSEQEIVAGELNLLTRKPFLYVVNVNDNQLLQSAPFLGDGINPKHIIQVCAKTEAELAELSVEDANMLLAELGMKISGLDSVIRASYDALGLITFLTTGEKETRAWTIPLGTKAPQAAGVIHTDFEKAFIRAEIISYKDFVECGSEAEAKNRGMLRVEGKDYVMNDGDVVHFRVNA